MVDGSGNALIMDFGLASVVRDPSSVASTSDGGYTVRWGAPEILQGITVVSKKSDVFSFAMVTIEVRGRLVLDVSTDLFVDSGFLRASSVRRCLSAGSHG
jgi:serine/threonine protein kinase